MINVGSSVCKFMLVYVYFCVRVKYFFVFVLLLLVCVCEWMGFRTCWSFRSKIALDLYVPPLCVFICTALLLRHDSVNKYQNFNYGVSPKGLCTSIAPIRLKIAVILLKGSNSFFFNERFKEKTIYIITTFIKPLFSKKLHLIYIFYLYKNI